MVIQKKAGAATKQKMAEGKQKVPKLFQAKESDDDDDDIDMDFDEMGSDDDISDSDEEGQPSVKKTPAPSLKTPEAKSGKKDMHVSFQLTKTPVNSAQKMQKVRQDTPMVKKTKQLTPGSKQQAPSPKQGLAPPSSGKKEKKGLQEFKGMGSGSNTSFGGKAQPESPKKGKNQNVMSAKKGKAGKKAGQESDDDDGESDVEDSDDDDDDINDDDIRQAFMALKGKKTSQKGAQGKKQAQEEESEDEDEDDDDDFDDDDDLDDSEIDDDELASDEEIDDEIRKTLMQMKEKKQNQLNDKTNQKAAKSLQKAQSAPHSAGLKASQKTPNKIDQKPAEIKKSPKAAAKNEGKMQRSQQQSTQASQQQQSPVIPQSEMLKEAVSIEAQRKRERDARHLFVRSLPADVTAEELKTLSPDIINVSMPKSKYKRARKIKSVYAFLEFASEKKAEENYAILQKKKLRGQSLFVDYAGHKSLNRDIASMHNKTEEPIVYNMKKLFVSGLSLDTNISQVAALFPKAVVLIMNNSPEYRVATATFANEADAAEAYKANENCKLNGKLITILYSKESPKKKKAAKRAQPQKSAGPPAKKVKQEQQQIKQEEESEDDDDDDEDEDDDDEE